MESEGLKINTGKIKVMLNFSTADMVEEEGNLC